jgi:hypothetical protein
MMLVEVYPDAMPYCRSSGVQGRPDFDFPDTVVDLPNPAVADAAEVGVEAGVDGVEAGVDIGAGVGAGFEFEVEVENNTRRLSLDSDPGSACFRLPHTPAALDCLPSH